MTIEREWENIYDAAGNASRRAGGGILRVTLLFGSAAVALALILTPVLVERDKQMASRPVLDTMSTGSLPPAHASQYTLKRSVLSTSPHMGCRTTSDGVRSGNC